MINQCYKDPVRKHVVNKIGQVLRLEIKAMCSDRVSSILQSMNSDNLKTFRWDLVLSELKLHAPMLMDILFSCTKTKFLAKIRLGLCVSLHQYCLCEDGCSTEGPFFDLVCRTLVKAGALH